MKIQYNNSGISGKGKYALPLPVSDFIIIFLIIQAGKINGTGRGTTLNT